MEKKVIINQFFGLGDILFIEPIYRHFHNQGYKVIAPVEDELYWIMHYINYVHFKKKSEFEYDYESIEQRQEGDTLHIPLRFAHPLYRGLEPHDGSQRENWMCDKYLYLGLDKDLWRTLKWDRSDKEDSLYRMLGIKGKYNLINENFGGGFQKLEIDPNNDLPNVYVNKIDEFTLLDWAKVIENATNIYTVETSIIYMIEVLKTKAKELIMYPRFPYLENVDYIKGYLNKNWICREIH